MNEQANDGSLSGYITTIFSDLESRHNRLYNNNCWLGNSASESRSFLERNAYREELDSLKKQVFYLELILEEYNDYLKNIENKRDFEDMPELEGVNIVRKAGISFYENRIEKNETNIREYLSHIYG